MKLFRAPCLILASLCAFSGQALAIMSVPTGNNSSSLETPEDTAAARVAAQMFDRYTQWKEVESAVLKESGTRAENAIEEMAKNSQYAYRESFEAIAKRVEKELSLMASGKAEQASYRVVLAGLRALRVLGRKSNVTGLTLIRQKLEILTKHSQPNLWKDRYEPLTRAILEETKKRDDELGSFLTAIVKVSEIDLKNGGKIQIISAVEPSEMVLLQKPTAPVSVRLAAVKNWMNSRVYGQPDAIEAFMELELRRLVFPYRKTSDSIWLMGMAGTGKDKMAREYVDAIHNDPKASEKHLLKIQPVKSDKDLWTHLGSPTGFYGSGKISPLMKFLALHSCGRYKIAEENDGQSRVIESIVENKEWKAGAPCPEGTFRPEEAVLYLDQLHSWSREAKELFIKPALEEGKWLISNPGTGVREMHVPVTFVLSSNDGAGLISSKDADGARVRKAATEKELFDRHDRNKRDSIVLNRELTRSRFVGNMDASNPADLVNVVGNIVLTGPLGREDLKKVIGDTIREYQRDLETMTGSGKMKITWDSELENRVLDFQYDAEDNARPVKEKVKKLVLDPLLKMIANGEINVDSKKETAIALTIKTLDDKSWALEASVGAGKKPELLSRPIESTKILIPRPRMTPAEIDHLMTLGDRMAQHVYGVQDVIEKVSRALIVMEERRNAYKAGDRDAPAARIFAFLGLSSTGKTQTPKAIARELYGSEEAMVTIDFSQIRTVQDLKDKILGSIGRDGKPVVSEFMRLHDLHHGRVLFVFDEIANAPKDVIKALYDILRESTVTTFSDGKERGMNNTTIVMTGNASEEFYQTIPHDIPFEEKLAAMRQIYKKLQGDPDLVLHFLQNYFSPATLRRIGAENIFLFPPLDARAVRELTQAKLLSEIKNMKARESSWGWNVFFQSAANYTQALEVMEKAAFNADEQGASIDRFMKQNFAESLRLLLLKNHVESDSQVVLRPVGEMTEKTADRERRFLRFEVQTVQSKSPLILDIPLAVKSKYLNGNDEDQKITAQHEAGHNLVRKLLLGDFWKSSALTILPGVAEIDGRMVRYEGLASNEKLQKYPTSMTVIIREMASLLAGRVAQQLTVDGAFTDAGQANDLQRATRTAQIAIVNHGLHEEWGLEVTDLSQEKLGDYINRLPEERKTLLKKLTDQMIRDAEEIARISLLKNMETLVALGNYLAEEGELTGTQIDEFYKGRTLQIPKDEDLAGLAELWKKQVPAKKGYLAQPVLPSLRKDLPQPKKVADIQQILAKERMEAVASVAIPQNAPILENSGAPAEGTESCETPLIIQVRRNIRR